MRSLAILMSLLLFTSCVDFRGEYTSEQDVTFVHSTMFGNEKEKTLPAGDYRTNYRLNDFSNKLRFSFKREGKDNLNVKIEVPENINIPKRSGEFYLEADQTGQNFDIRGTVNSDRSRSRTYHRTETCTYTVYRRVCRDDTTCSTDNSGNTRCRTTTVCSDEPDYRTGHREVSYYYENVNKSFKLELLEPASNTDLGVFDGRDSESDKVYEHKGHCRRY